MRLYTQLGMIGLVVLAGRPTDLVAKRRDAVVVDATNQPGADLNDILRNNGWTILNLPNNIYKPGKLFRPDSSSSEGSCIDAEPITGDLPSIEAQGSKGFVVDVGANAGPIGGSVGVQATSFKLKSTTDVEQAVIEGMDMQLNDKCIAHLADLQAKGHSLQGWFVVQETARARVKEVKCSSQEAVVKLRAMWIARGELGEMSDCVQSTEMDGVIAYKARPVLELLPVSAVSRMPDIAPQQTENGQATPSSVKNSVGMYFVKIPAGSFVMGCTAEQGSDCFDDEKPAHKVTLNRSFYMQTTEVTQGQWKSVMGSNPSRFSGCNACPVEMVSWDDAVAFARKLSVQEGLSGGSAYRLPTEAEWEYAARAGQGTKYAGSNSLDAVAWYKGNSGSKTHPVGQQSPNAWGLYDMSGNVYEWTADWWGRYSRRHTTNPEGASSGRRVLRGGGWDFTAANARVANRGNFLPVYRFNILGFRLARTIP
jgi:formylglycine-generating enzyme required for sulfatase activity